MQKGDRVVLSNYKLNRVSPELRKYNPIGIAGQIIETNHTRSMEVVSKDFKSKLGVSHNVDLERAKWRKTVLKSDCVVEWSNGFRNSYSFRDLKLV